eukprot:COSAG03_NODE_16241_length_407_cov_1.344156_2_plen_104_part_01
MTAYHPPLKAAIRSDLKGASLGSSYFGMAEVGRQTPHTGALTVQQTQASWPQDRLQASEDPLYQPTAATPRNLLVKLVDAVPKHPQLLPQPLPIEAPLRADSQL